MKGTNEKSTTTGIRLTPSQASAWREAASCAGYSNLSAWLRSVAQQAIKTGVTGQEIASELAGLRQELSAIGNNLNQLTRYAHRTQQAPDVTALIHEIHAVTREVHRSLLSLNRVKRRV